MTVWRPIFVADWKDALFIHFRVDPDRLSRVVPFELDLCDGDAFVSLVAFTQKNLRPVVGGKLAAWLTAPLAEHEFLNLRAYVRVNGEPAIYFLSEWIPNRLAVLIGPRLYGLPYRLGELRYQQTHERQIRGRVAAPQGCLKFRAEIGGHPEVAPENSLSHFFLERDVAYTHRNGVSRRFRVAHARWPQTSVQVELLDTSLLRSIGAVDGAELIGGNYSSGVSDVGISPPQKIRARVEYGCYAT